MGDKVTEKKTAIRLLLSSKSLLLLLPQQCELLLAFSDFPL